MNSIEFAGQACWDIRIFYLTEHFSYKSAGSILVNVGFPNIQVNRKPHKTARQMNVCITFCELKILRCLDHQNAVSTKAHQTNGQRYIQLPCCEHFLTLFSLFCVGGPPCCNTLLDTPRFGTYQRSSDLEGWQPPHAFRYMHRCR